MGILLKNGGKLFSMYRHQKWIKLKGSTLVETLVATVLIVTIFSIASLVLNSIFKSTVQKHIDQTVNTRLLELKYLYTHEKITSKHQEMFSNWAISMSKMEVENQSIVLIEAVEETTNKIISKQFVDDHIE